MSPFGSPTPMAVPSDKRNQHQKQQTPAPGPSGADGVDLDDAGATADIETFGGDLRRGLPGSCGDRRSSGAKAVASARGGGDFGLPGHFDRARESRWGRLRVMPVTIQKILRERWILSESGVSEICLGRKYTFSLVYPLTPHSDHLQVWSKLCIL